MRKSFKAALLSCVLGSGAGHLYLKRYRRGAILIMSTLSCLLVILTQALQQAEVVFEKLGPERGMVSFDEIAVLLSETSSSSDFLMMNTVTMLLMVIWTIGIVDAYKIGREMESEKSP